MDSVKTLKELAVGHPADAREVTGLSYDSRLCKHGYVFFAFPGIHSQGTEHVMDAIAHGATTVVTPVKLDLPKGIAQIVEPRPRTLFSRMCSAFYDHPEQKLKIIGVTGTDGKTSTCEYLHQLLLLSGVHAGLIGTVSMDDGEGMRPSPYRQSTPEADQLEAFLKRCLDHGLDTVILECTSHALSSEYDRLDTIRYDIAVVTTVTSEHLEFHKSLEAYVDAKCNLVRRLKPNGLFISTTRNPHLDAFLQVLPAGCRHQVIGRDIDIRLTDKPSLTYEGTDYPVPVIYPVLAGNAALAALAAKEILHTELSQELANLSKLQAVDGRMEEIPNDFGLNIWIDFAHTADAYQKLFSFARGKIGNGRMIAVFGCAGERDTSKRAPMGRIASHYADVLVLTDEDPRGESSSNIDDDLMSDAEPVEVQRIDDRRQAIRWAISHAEKGDTLLFLGKGHEHSIEKQGVKYPWNERAEVETALKERATS